MFQKILGERDPDRCHDVSIGSEDDIGEEK